MAEPQYDLFFNAQLLDGFFEDFVKADLKTLFRTDDAYIDRLFNGQLQSVKTKVDKATAIRFQQAFKKAGAKLIVRPHNPNPKQAKAEPAVEARRAAAANPKSESPAPSSAQLSTTLAAVSGENDDRLIEHHQPDLEPPAQVPSWDIAAPGALLSTSEPKPSVSVDTQHLSLANAGSNLTDPSFEPPANVVSTEHLSVAPPGSDLETLNESQPPVQVDTHHLSVAD
ncbi:hypothetical protein [Reinekea blandensis]|uniref:Uncharacterized protein n=1 Tax=Reinekea blandensis MED297 TaxID=314283 RepID=A4BK64_9GAMM|nr:hypothetical protein [Reinekea blandensis]EAR07493.1 hypothetical protein MED297_09641 [Reinekea sp. MED297] [Reinekea blandensis MED297]